MQFNIPGGVVRTYRNLVRTDSSRKTRNPREIRDIFTGFIKRSSLCGILETAELENSLMYQIPLYDGSQNLGEYRLIVGKDNHNTGKCYVVKAILSAR